MITSLTSLKLLSWLSQASYLDFTGVPAGTNGSNLKTLLTNNPLSLANKFAEKQADIFTDAATGYSFQHHQPNISGNGFSATVFKSNADSSYTIAVRGTEPGLSGVGVDDLLRADLLGVVLSGKAREQALEAYRYYRRLESPAGQVVYSMREVETLVCLKFSKYEGKSLTELRAQAGFATDVVNMYATLATDTGLGILPAGAAINFTGHSLGGHVAVLLAELVGENQGRARVGEVVTYNAPGQGGWLPEIANWFGQDATRDTGVLAGKATHIVGEGGLNVTAGMAVSIGVRNSMMIERDGLLTGDPFSNHSIVKLSDSLAIHDLYARLSPARTQAEIALLIRSSAQSRDSDLEGALDALRKLLIGIDVIPTPAESRESLYNHLAVLQTNPAYRALQGGAAVRLTAVQGRDELVTKAKSDFGHFLAVKYLLPVAIEGAVGTLSGVHGDLHTQWQADRALTPEQRKQGQATYSDEYLADRAAFLTWKNHLALRDRSAAAAPYTNAPDAWFRDYASGLVIHLGATLTDSTAKPNDYLSKFKIGLKPADAI